jgi:hypothetical protein
MLTHGGSRKNKHMETEVTCPHCAVKQEEERQAEEFNLAVLLSLVPLMAFTLFGQMGLF